VYVCVEPLGGLRQALKNAPRFAGCFRIAEIISG
jgi:hypothetical protein